MYHNSLSRYDIDMGKLFPAILLKFKCLFKYVEAIVGFHIPKKFYFKGKKSSSLSEIDNIKKLVNFIHHSIINRF